MNKSADSATKQSLSKASIVGVTMAVGGIILFLVLYVALTNAGADAITRIFVSLCIPPGIMAALIGGYFLIKQPLVKPKVPSETDEKT